MSMTTYWMLAGWLLFLMWTGVLSGQVRSLEQEIQQRAYTLSQRYLITDGHVDLPYRLRIQNFRMEKEYLGIPIETEEGDFDYRRAKAGGLDAPFMSIYIPARYQENGGAKALADSLIDMVRGIAEAHPVYFRVVNSVAETRKAWQDGAIALPMGMENGAPVEDDLANVAYFKKRGVSYITLTHSKDNQICDSSYDTTRTWNGLSPFGREIVAEMNRVGVMIDISHVSDSTFWQVMELSQAPCIASHSSARKFTPGFERNMNDDMIKALAINGGVIQINFGSTFLDGKVQAQRDSLRQLMQQELAAMDMTPQDPGYEAFVENFRTAHPALFADVQTVADHIDHVVELSGIDHVAFGSDFDGVGDSLPTGLKDVSMYPNLIAELLRRGYSESDIEKICSGNVFRVWRQVELLAARYAK
jgi:membrane dipeptidase